MARLRLQGIEKYYGKVHAVRGVDLDIAEGEFAVLVGPSGCGKSTLLRCIAGLEEVDRGTVTIGDDVVNDMRPRDRNLAMVFQNYALYPYMNVYENIAFGLKARRVNKAEIEDRVRRAADTLGIDALLDRLPRALSGGQRQRVAIGRAIVRDARLFLFDEPLSNLDAQLRDEMRTEIKRLHQDLGKTMVYVTHDQIEAMTLADRIVLLRDGLIEQEGAPLELFERPASKFVARFLGSPPINFIPAVLIRDGAGLAVRCGAEVVFALPPERQATLNGPDGRPIILGLRPEHITGAGHAAGRREGLVRHRVTIDLVQPTGTRLYGAFALAGTEVLAELQAHDVERPGETIEVLIDMNRAILIDPESERVL
jgi:multiple sugar transport system ATP-binding protein